MIKLLKHVHSKFKINYKHKRVCWRTFKVPAILILSIRLNSYYFKYPYDTTKVFGLELAEYEKFKIVNYVELYIAPFIFRSGLYFKVDLFTLRMITLYGHS